MQAQPSGNAVDTSQPDMLTMSLHLYTAMGSRAYEAWSNGHSGGAAGGTVPVIGKEEKDVRDLYKLSKIVGDAAFRKMAENEYLLGAGAGPHGCNGQQVQQRAKREEDGPVEEVGGFN